jgi:chemotaxis protein MotB
MIQEEAPPKVPDWFVSFADMMTLLLTFFIMLISFSEPKEDAHFNAVMEQLQRQFGHDLSKLSLTPGSVLARQAQVAKEANEARQRRLLALQGSDSRVRMVRPGEPTAIGTVVFFEPGSAELSPQTRREVAAQAAIFAGKPQKIEIRGHTSLLPAERSTGSDDHWGLAYERSRAVMRYMTEELQIDPERLRLSVAGPTEPLHLGVDPVKMLENPRVELYLLEEVVSDLTGTPAERQGRFVPAQDE